MLKKVINDIERRVAKISLGQFVSMVAGTRLILFLCLWFLTRGRELSNDVAMHMEMVRAPLSVLLYTRPPLEQHPPLLPVLEALVAYPVQLVASDFIAIRALMIAYEVFLAFLFFKLLGLLAFSDRRRAFCLAAFLFFPTGWMTSTIMAQDDCIGACAFLLPLLLYFTGRRTLALFLCGAGVVAAKLFVILELLVLVPFATSRQIPTRRLKDSLIAISAIVLIYGPMTVRRIINSQPLPLVGFRPDIYFGTNFWMVLRRSYGLNVQHYGSYTGVLALIASTIPVWILVRSDQQPSPRRLLLAVGAATLIFFSLFYHVEPEYFTIVMPVLLLAAENTIDAVCLALVSVLPWMGKFFQNASFLYRANSTPGKIVAVQIFERLFHASPLLLLTANQIFFSMLTIAVCVLWTRKLLCHPTEIAPSSHAGLQL